MIENIILYALVFIMCTIYAMIFMLVLHSMKIITIKPVEIKKKRHLKIVK